MLRHPSPEQLQIEMMSIDTLVTQDHFVRLIDTAMDLDLIRGEIAEILCKNSRGNGEE